MMLKAIPAVVVSAPLFLLGACVPLPVPHHSVNAPRFSGRVVNAVTRRPVMGANVVLRGLDDTAVQTDAAGHFVTRISHTTHAAGLYTYDDGLRLQFPPARRSDGVLLVTHSGYRSAEVPADCAPYPQPLLADDKVETRALPDVRLQPAPR